MVKYNGLFGPIFPLTIENCRNSKKFSAKGLEDFLYNKKV